MIEPARPGLRGLRAAVFGVSALVLALGAHVAAGGAAPGLGSLALVAFPVACVSVGMARRIRRGPVLFAALAASQVVLHEVFMAAAMPMHCASVVHAGHGAVSATCDAGAPMSHATGTHASWMVLAHALATMATALVLAHGERTLARAWAWVRPSPVAPVMSLPSLSTIHVLASSAADRLQAAVHASDLSRRGPPPRGAVPLFVA